MGSKYKTDVPKDKRDCRYSRVCKSTRRGTWVDCSLGKGLICQPNMFYCLYTPYKYEDIKECVMCECTSLSDTTNNELDINCLKNNLVTIKKALKDIVSNNCILCTYTEYCKSNEEPQCSVYIAKKALIEIGESDD